MLKIRFSLCHSTVQNIPCLITDIKKSSCLRQLNKVQQNTAFLLPFQVISNTPTVSKLVNTHVPSLPSPTFNSYYLPVPVYPILKATIKIFAIFEDLPNLSKPMLFITT